MMTLTAADITARIARNLRVARELAGLSQSEAAKRLDPPVRRNEIRRWENGLHRPHEITLLQLASVYGQDAGWFFAEHDEAA